MKTVVALLAISALFAVSQAALSSQDFCWKDTYGRGVGVPLSICKDGLDKDGLLCYPKCNAGFYGVGPVCWGSCPNGLKDTGTQCEKPSYGRGAGRPVHTCSGNEEQNGALCYPRCNNGMYGVGPVCWSRCNDGYHDDGLFCRKDVHIYGKGCCCTIFGCCENKCNAGYANDPCTCRRDAHIYAKGSYGRGAGSPLKCADNEDLNGALCYPKCNSGMNGVGPVCWGQCGGQTTDIGALCVKKTYGRTAGVPMICKPDQQEQAGLCYTPCKPGFYGVGPVCWANCPAGWSDCGAACAHSAKGCADKIINMVTDSAMVVTNIAASLIGMSGATKAAQVAAKVAKYTKQSVTVVKKLKGYADEIYEQAMAQGQQITEAEAQARAEETFAAAAEATGDNSWEAALDAIEQADPTGAVAAAKAFMFPQCSKFQQ